MIKPTNPPEPWQNYARDANDWVAAYLALCDCFLYPVVHFPAAHALELYLKAVCLRADPNFFPPDKGHRLWDLWIRADADSISGFRVDRSLQSKEVLGGELSRSEMDSRDLFYELYVALEAVTDLKYLSVDWKKVKREGLSRTIPNLQWISLFREFRINLGWPSPEMRFQDERLFDRRRSWRPRTYPARYARDLLVAPIGLSPRPYPKWIRPANRVIEFVYLKYHRLKIRLDLPTSHEIPQIY